MTEQMRLVAVAAMMATTLTGCSSFNANPPARAERFARPDVIRFGAGVTEVERSLARRRETLRLRQVDPPFLPNVRQRQMQIDCDGFSFLDQPRHVEFVFRDDSLVMAWVMATPAEAGGIIAAMTDAYGPPTHSNVDYIAFENDRAAWRRQPTEILFCAPELDADMAPDFD